MRAKILLLVPWVATVVSAWAAGDKPSEYTNLNSVINTRHNFTFKSLSGTELLAGAPNLGGPTPSVSMLGGINGYGQVCVFCHTPHGANASAAAPLWNRATPATAYTTYNELGTNVGQTYAQPGGASLACLSCHDGQQAVDAIMNMPGSGHYSATPMSGTFLNFWPGPGDNMIDHVKLPECLGCHSPANTSVGSGKYATDFTIFVTGTDLRNDHPVGVNYPTSTGAGTDWNTPSGTKAIAGQAMKYFDETPNSRLDKNEIRLYPSANGPAVECASCHDPHGVPSAGPGSTFNPSFLRKSIASSNLCLTCHAK